MSRENLRFTHPVSAINFLIIPAAWLTAAAAAVAAPVLGNLSVPSVDRVVPVTYNEWQASSFTLSDTAGPWRVRSVRLRMAQDVPNTSFTLRITGQSALRPAWNDVRVAFQTPALIAAATGPSTGAPAGTVEFVVQNTPAPVLQPGETYWLVTVSPGRNLSSIPLGGGTTGAMLRAAMPMPEVPPAGSLACSPPPPER